MNEAAPQPTAEIDDYACDPLEEWEILSEVVMALVSQPTKTSVTQRVVGTETHLSIRVAPEDLGKIIGKNGETASILRKLFGRIAATRGRKTFIHIEEPARIGKTTRTSGYRRNVAA